MLLVLGIVLLAFLYYKGFRVTYAPELENSWDAISGCAAWVGAIGTILAVFFAVTVANKQNKISLFEKRLEVLYTIQTLKDFSDALNTAGFEQLGGNSCEPAKKNKIIMISYMNIAFGLDIDYRDEKKYIQQVHDCINQLRKRLISLYLLYPFKNAEEIKRDIQNVIAILGNMTASVFFADEVKMLEKDPNIYKKSFIEETNKFYQKYYQLIEGILNFNRW